MFNVYLKKVQIISENDIEAGIKLSWTAAAEETITKTTHFES